MLEFESLRPEDANRTFTYDGVKGQLQMVDRIDDGRNRLSNGIIYDSVITNIFSILKDSHSPHVWSANGKSKSAGTIG